MNVTSAPLIQQHELTWQCNNNCLFCYNPERCLPTFEPRKYNYNRNISIANISVKKGVMAVCLTGGEPLLLGDHFFKVLDIYKQAGCYTSINTNGRLITDDTAKKLAQSKLNSALVSIHGIGSIHENMVGVKDSFLETWNGVLALKSHGIIVTPNFVLTPKNINGLYDFGENAVNQGFTQISVTPFLPSWKSFKHKNFLLTHNHYKNYFKIIKQLQQLGLNIDTTLPIPPCLLIKLFPNTWKSYVEVFPSKVCMAGRSFGTISPDGLFRACIQAPYFSKYGGAVQKSYSDSWEKANIWAMRRFLPSECLQCSALNICGGGCRSSCLWENKGSLYGKTMYMEKALTEEQAFYFQHKNISGNIANINLVYKFKKTIKFRKEKWGIIIFNVANQSFTILSKSFIQDVSKIRSVKFTSKKVLAVLLAIQALETLREDQGNSLALEDISVLPGSLLLPRLANGLSNDYNVCYLRADTGERYFF